jgi:hypothetical protein
LLIYESSISGTLNLNHKKKETTMLEFGLFALAGFLYLNVILLSALTMHEPPVRIGYEAASSGWDGGAGRWEEGPTPTEERESILEVGSEVAA